MARRFGATADEQPAAAQTECDSVQGRSLWNRKWFLQVQVGHKSGSAAAAVASAPRPSTCSSGGASFGRFALRFDVKLTR